LTRPHADPPTRKDAHRDLHRRRPDGDGGARSIRGKGIKVPIDVSLVGFDDIAGAGYLVPALTTVRQDIAKLGATSIGILRDIHRDTARHPSGYC